MVQKNKLKFAVARKNRTIFVNIVGNVSIYRTVRISIEVFHVGGDSKIFITIVKDCDCLLLARTFQGSPQEK